jgi:hypothetical protein
MVIMLKAEEYKPHSTNKRSMVGLKALGRGLGVGESKRNKKPMDCAPWVSCFCIMKVKKKTPPTSKKWMGKGLFEEYFSY